MVHSPSYDDVRPQRSLVTDTELAEALYQMATAAEPIGGLTAREKLLKAQAEAAYAAALLNSVEKSKERREADAQTSPRYNQLMAQWAEACGLLETARRRYDVEKVRFEVWRTIQANARVEQPPPARRDDRRYGE